MANPLNLSTLASIAAIKNIDDKTSFQRYVKDSGQKDGHDLAFERIKTLGDILELYKKVSTEDSKEKHFFSPSEIFRFEMADTIDNRAQRIRKIKAKEEKCQTIQKHLPIEIVEKLFNIQKIYQGGNYDLKLDYATEFRINDLFKKIFFEYRKSAEFKAFKMELILSDAIKYGNEEIFNFLIDSFSDIELKELFRSRRSLSKYAVETPSEEIFRYLLDRNLIRIDHSNLLFSCFEKCNINKIKQVLAKGADINSMIQICEFPKIASLLNKVIESGNGEAFSLLIENEELYKSLENEDLLKLAIKSPSEKIFSICLDRCLFLISKTNPDDKNNFLTRSLFLTARFGDIQKIKLLLEKGADINATPYDSKTILHQAAKDNDASVVEFLLDCGIAVNSKDRFNRTPLYVAAAANEEKVVELLLKRGADVNIKTKHPFEDKDSALSNAVEAENLEVISVLLKACSEEEIKSVIFKNSTFPKLERFESFLNIFLKRNLNFSPEEFNTLFHRINNHFDNYDEKGNQKLLLKQTTHFSLEDIEKYKLLNYAVLFRDLNLVNFFIKKGADINAILGRDLTPLNISVSSVREEVDIEIIKVLLQNKASVNEIDYFGCTPLMVLLLRNDCSPMRNDIFLEKAMKLLFQYNADPKSLSEEQTSTLHAATRLMNIKIIEALIEKGVDVNSKNKGGRTPLHYVFSARRILNEKDIIPIINLLIKKGADVNSKDKKGQTPLHVALANNMGQNVIEALVEKGSDVNSKDKDGLTPFIFAIERDKFELAKKFIEKGADLNAKIDGKPLLINLIKKGDENRFQSYFNYNIRKTKTLLELGFDVNAKDDKNNTAKTKTLLELGFDVNAKDDKNNTALYYAVLNKKNDLIELLLNNKAKVDIKTIRAAQNFEIQKKLTQIYFSQNKSKVIIPALLVGSLGLTAVYGAYSLYNSRSDQQA
jgi:ankyrin repeat protein